MSISPVKANRRPQREGAGHPASGATLGDFPHALSSNSRGDAEGARPGPAGVTKARRDFAEGRCPPLQVTAAKGLGAFHGLRHGLSGASSPSTTQQVDTVGKAGCSPRGPPAPPHGPRRRVWGGTRLWPKVRSASSFTGHVSSSKNVYQVPPGLVRTMCSGAAAPAQGGPREAGPGAGRWPSGRPHVLGRAQDTALPARGHVGRAARSVSVESG